LDTLTVWRFEAPHTAEQALPRLERLAREGDVDLNDAALVSWPPAHRKPSTRELGVLTGPGMLWGGFWGIVLALIFLTPIAGPTFGAGAGAVAGSLSDFGVEDDFVKRVRDAVTPGTSALFVISTSASADRIAVALEDVATDTIRSTLSYEQQQRLRDALGDESSRQVG
jgi:uncharacterized membrane protein